MTPNPNGNNALPRVRPVAAALLVTATAALTAAVTITNWTEEHYNASVRVGEALRNGSTEETLEFIAVARANLAKIDDPITRGETHGIIGYQYDRLAGHHERLEEDERAHQLMVTAVEHYRHGAETGDVMSNLQLADLALSDGDPVPDDPWVALAHGREAFRGTVERPFFDYLRLETGLFYHLALVRCSIYSDFRDPALVVEAVALERAAHRYAARWGYWDEICWIDFNGVCLRLRMIEAELMEMQDHEDFVHTLHRCLDTAPPSSQENLARYYLEDRDLKLLRGTESFEALEERSRAIVAAWKEKQDKAK